MKNESDTQFEKIYDQSPHYLHVVSGHKKLSVCYFPHVGWGFVLWIRQETDGEGFSVYQAIASECSENWSADEAMKRGLTALQGIR